MPQVLVLCLVVCPEEPCDDGEAGSSPWWRVPSVGETAEERIFPPGEFPSPPDEMRDWLLVGGRQLLLGGLFERDHYRWFRRILRKPLVGEVVVEYCGSRQKWAGMYDGSCIVFHAILDDKLAAQSG